MFDLVRSLKSLSWTDLLAVFISLVVYRWVKYLQNPVCDLLAWNRGLIGAIIHL
jgi:hypothetical protein